MILGVVMAALLAGCGSDSEEDQLRNAVREFARDARAHKWGDVCAATTNPSECSNSIAGAVALGVNVAEFIPSEDRLDDMRVTVRGDRATVDSTAGEDATWVKRDGRWLAMMETD